MSRSKSGAFVEKMGEEQDMRKCSRSTKLLLFILNFVIWAGSCALLALGIYALLDNPVVRPLLGDSVLTMAAIVVVTVGGLGFFISFLGCCGAFSNSKCLIMTYVVVLIILLATLLVGAILGFMFSNKAEDAAIDVMQMSLEKYDPNEEDSKIVMAWNDAQRSLKCCGVMGHRDWEEKNERFPLSNSDKLPESCCKLTEEFPRPTAACLRQNNQNAIHDTGCYKKATELVKKHSPIIGIVGAVVAFCMIAGVLLGLVVYKRL